MLPDILQKRYKILAKIGDGGMSIVYKVDDTQKGRIVAVKILKEDRIKQRGAENIIRFQREARTVSLLDHPQILKVLEVGDEADQYYLVTEYIEGETLAIRLKKGIPVTVAESVEIVRQLTEALAYVHEKGIIHRDIKPANVMLAASGKEVKILDFGLAQLMEFTEIKNEDEVVGTFSYMSPEQAGMTRKPVDERSDLYSLGVIFYEMLTGELPFKGRDVGTILHQQAARKPTSPATIRPGIPPILEEMVLKLLNKEPEERYQTARGLLADLKRYQSGEVSFLIGKEDRLRKLSYRTRLIGREQELEQLKKIFDQSFTGQGQICLISGDAGLGKSRLIDEIRRYAYERGGVLINGKCFSQENKIPYQPFKDALNEYLYFLSQEDAGEQEAAKARMKELLGQLGGIMLGFNPHLKDILGVMPPLVPLDAERKNRRFLMVSSRFFCGLGKENAPCVLFIDDLHWADDGTLSLLTEMSEEIKNHPFLLVGTFRGNEVSETHGLARLKNEAAQKSYALHEIDLKPFDHERLKKFTAELLLEDEARVEDLTRYVLNKSKGNPFFAIELIRQLVDEKALVYQEGTRFWQINWDQVNRISVPVTIVDLVLRRIETLDKDLLILLSCAAFIGREFELDLLFLVMDFNQEKATALLDEAVVLQLIEVGKVKGRMLFVHDRVRDAFYKRLTVDERKKIHLRIALAIEELHKNDLESVLFDLLHHYMEVGDKDKVLRYCLPAASKAKESYANEEAIRCYAAALAILEEKGEQASMQWLEAKEGLATVYLTIGRNDEAIEISHQILPFKKTPVEKAGIYKQIGGAYFKKGDWLKCEDNLA